MLADFRRLSEAMDRFIPASALLEADGLRLSAVLIRASFAVAVFSTGLASFRFLLDGRFSAVGLVLLAVAVASASVPWLLKRSGSLEVSGIVLPLIGLAGAFSMALFEGGLGSEALFWLVLVPLVADLFAGARGGYLLTVVGALALSVLLAIELIGPGAAQPESPETALLLRYLGACGALLFGAALGRFYATRRHLLMGALDEGERRNRSLLAAMPDTLIRLDHRGLILDLQRPVDPEKPLLTELVPGGRISELVPRETARLILRAVRQADRSGTVATAELTVGDLEDQREIEIRVVPGDALGHTAVIRDITARNRALRLRDEFVSVVSHELRTPLTAIRGAFGLLRAGAGGELGTEALRLVELAERNSLRLTQLIDDLLDLQRLEQGRIAFHFQSASVVGLLDETLELNRGFADQWESELRCVSPEQDMWVLVDRRRFQQVLSNLVSNAVKYSPRGEHVEVSAERTDDLVRIHVMDRGPGIPPEFRDHIFDKFTQVDASTTRRVGGSGLGLHITRRLVEAMDGRISFADRDGGGTVFTVELPRTGPGSGASADIGK